MRKGSGNPMFGKHSWNNGKKLHYKVWNKGLKGLIPWNKGKKSLVKVWNKGKKLGPLSIELKLRLSESHRGEKSHLWKGGKDSLNHLIRGSFKYRQWRSDIFTRDNFTCQYCSSRGCYLNAHHLKEFYKIVDEYKIKTLEQAFSCEELWNINNGITLCEDCHNKTKPGRV